MRGDRGRDDRVDRIAREVATLRAELMVFQGVMALVAAEASSRAPDPVEALGEITAGVLGFADLAGRAIGADGYARDVTDAALRFCDTAERLLQRKPLAPEAGDAPQGAA